MQSDEPIHDCDAWELWPHHRVWFNKLDFSLKMGYDCGPCGTAPKKSGSYVVRPIYNLSGMGIGARRAHIEADDRRSVEPGYFWCEWFSGPQHSVTYVWDGRWVPLSSWCGYRDESNLSRFTKWVRSDYFPELPDFMDELNDVGVINVEYIGDKPIEVHLRPSPDPEDGDEIVPVWADSDVDGYFPDFEDGDGFLPIPRLGFIIRKTR